MRPRRSLKPLCGSIRTTSRRTTDSAWSFSNSTSPKAPQRDSATRCKSIPTTLWRARILSNWGKRPIHRGKRTEPATRELLAKFELPWLLVNRFPLTPALSPRERENHRPSFGDATSVASRKRVDAASPPPEGEGRGEVSPKDFAP